MTDEKTSVKQKIKENSREKQLYFKKIFKKLLTNHLRKCIITTVAPIIQAIIKITPKALFLNHSILLLQSRL